jgi:hypothetical protein
MCNTRRFASRREGQNNRRVCHDQSPPRCRAPRIAISSRGREGHSNRTRQPLKVSSHLDADPASFGLSLTVSHRPPLSPKLAMESLNR